MWAVCVAYCSCIYSSIIRLIRSWMEDEEKNVQRRRGRIRNLMTASQRVINSLSYLFIHLKKKQKKNRNILKIYLSCCWWWDKYGFRFEKWSLAHLFHEMKTWARAWAANITLSFFLGTRSAPKLGAKCDTTRIRVTIARSSSELASSTGNRTVRVGDQAFLRVGYLNVPGA